MSVRAPFNLFLITGKVFEELVSRPQCPKARKPYNRCAVVALYFMWNGAQPVGAARTQHCLLISAPRSFTTFRCDRTIARNVRDLPEPAYPVTTNRNGW